MPGTLGVLLAWLIISTTLRAQQAPATDIYQAQYSALLAKYGPQMQELISQERARQLLGKGAENPGFWSQVEALQEQFDKEFVVILQAASQANPAWALGVFISWERTQEITAVDTNSVLVKQVQSAAPSWQSAFQFVLDTLAKTCNESNAMEIAPKMVGAERGAQLLGGSLKSYQANFDACEHKATLMLDLDSRVAETNFDDFKSLEAHVRADHIKLKYDPNKDEFVAKGFPARYVSLDAVPVNQCDKAKGVSGTLDAYAKMTRTPGELRQYVVQIFPSVSEEVERLILKMHMGSDGEVRKPCADMDKQRARDHWAGYVLTHGSAPFTLQLGASDVLAHDTTMGAVQFNGNMVVTLAGMGPPPVSKAPTGGH
jgi:hypothetical protein